MATRTLTSKSTCQFHQRCLPRFYASSKKFQKSQQLLTAMTTQFQNQHKILRAEKSRNTYSADILANNITEIHYDPASGKKPLLCGFKCWIGYLSSWFFSQRWKIEWNLQIYKLGTKEHAHYMNYILPKKATDFIFTEKVDQLREVFRKKHSVF